MKNKVIFLILLIIMITILSSCSSYYTYEEVDGIGYGYSENLNRAFISEIPYRIGDSTDIIIPDTYNGIPITDLGGYFGRGVPCPFCIEIFDLDEMYQNENASILYSYMDELEERISLGEEFSYIDITFNVTLPKTLETIENSRANAIYILESINYIDLEKPIVYRTLFNFTISEENPYFYTKDGKLYDKKTDKLIEDFLYS